MKKLLGAILLFLVISTSSLIAKAGSLYINVGYSPFLPWSTTSYFGSYSYFPYYSYYRSRAPIFTPIELPNINLTNRLMALGETKKEAWLEARNMLSTPAKTNIPFPSETLKLKPSSPELDIPEIKMDKASEISMNSY